MASGGSDVGRLNTATPREEGGASDARSHTHARKEEAEGVSRSEGDDRADLRYASQPL